MAIPIQCPECHKKYQAPDHMAGKRVKCKHCGVIFLVAADARTADAALDLSALNELSAAGEPAKRNAGKGGADGGGGAEEGEGIESFFHCDYPSDGAPRTNKLYVFPMSRLLDHWLPPVLLAVGLLWAVSEAYQRNDTNRAWVGVFRGALFLLAFFASTYPFTLMGVRAASCRLNYELPPRPGLRVMGTYAVPFALACAMWLVLGGASGLLIGTLVGCVVSLPLLFLLFRLLPREAPITFGYATGSFLLSLVVSVAAVFALNLMLVGALRAMKSEQTLAASPFGPEFKWDAPAQRARDQLAQNPPPVEPEPVAEGTGDAPPDTAPATDDTGTDVATTAPSGATTRTAVAGGPGTPRPSVPSERDVVAPSEGSADAGRTAVTTTDPPVNPNPNPNPNPNDQPANAKGGVEVAAGFAGDVRVVVPGPFRQVVYPAVPGTSVAVVREGRLPGHDRVEVWATAEWKKAAELDVPRTPQGNRYALSPDGQFLTYVTDFPRLAVQVWSVSAGRQLRQIELDAADGNTETLGFAGPEQLVLRRRPNGQPSLQVINVKTGARPRLVPAPEVELDPARYALSPDGDAIAFIIPSNSGADLESYSLATGRPIKQMPIGEVNWANNVTVAGLAFSPDGDRIAAIIADGRGAGLVVAWPAAGRSGRAVLQQLLPVGVDVPQAHQAFGQAAFEGRPFHWLDNGRAWLLFGTSVFDTDTGTLLGSPKLPQVRRQSTRPDGNAAHLVANDEFGTPHLFEVRFDLEGARKRLINK